MTSGHQTTDPRLEALGAALHSAAAADLDASPSHARTHRASEATVLSKPRRRRRRMILGGLAAAIMIPGAAVAANALISNDEVARSLPNGILGLLDTHPRCTEIQANVSFDCVVDHAPQGKDVAVPTDGWKGTVEPTDNDAKMVNGGCRALNEAGTHWRCYIGEEAIRQQIIGPDYLGKQSAGPSAG